MMSINTKRKAINQHSKSNYEILDNLRTGILILDDNFDYVFANSAAYSILGVSNNLPKIIDLYLRFLISINCLIFIFFLFIDLNDLFLTVIL